jgi:ATP synthase protein I
MREPERGLDEAAERAAKRAEDGRAHPEPSLASRLGQIGVLGWAIVTPVLIAVFVGRWLDRTFDSGVFFAAPAILIGAAFGLWTAWKWMHRS